MKIPRAISDLIIQFERLPGVGPKTAQRLTFYLLNVPQPVIQEFADALVRLKKGTVRCSICQNVAESDPCPICSDSVRDNTTVMVVEHPLDVLVVEATGTYDGLYHILGGVISPLENIGPDELFVAELLSRIRSGTIRELILGLNPTMEGEATSLYLKNQLSDIMKHQGVHLTLTRLGQGMPTGGDLQYADESTLRQALQGRRAF